jgi:hypothetical protein
MNGRRAVVGLCMLCALLVSAFAAQSASASKGTTAFTCTESAEVKNRFGAHCLEAGTPKNFGHVAIAQDTTTPIEGTAENTGTNTVGAKPTKLKMTIAGVATELEATALHGEGWMENKVHAEPKGEHYAIAHGDSITYTKVKVVKPAELGCKVYTSNEDTTKGEEGVVHTTPLKGTTTGEQRETPEPKHNVKIEPTTEGGAFAHFVIAYCKAPVEALNGPYTVSGSVTCGVNGATIDCVHNTITTANTLKVNGSIKAGIEGSLTLKNKTNGTPLSATTVET